MDGGTALKWTSGKRSIALRIAGYLLGYVIVLFLLLYILQIWMLPALYQRYYENQAVEQVTRMGAMLDRPGISQQVIRLARENTACIRILRQDGTEIYNLDLMTYCNLHIMSREELMTLWSRAEENGGCLSMIYDMDSDRLRRLVPSGSTAILYVQIFEGNSSQPTAIFYNAGISPIENVMAVLRRELIWMLALFLLVALALIFWVSRITVGPILNITKQARRLQKLDYTVAFQDNSYREIAELSDVLNATSRTLELLEKVRREIIANLSHDLRTPLAMVTAYAEIIRDVPGENTPENIQIIIDETNRLTKLVNEGLIYPESSDIMTPPLKISRFDIATLLRNVAERYEKFQVANLQEIRYGGPEHCPVSGDEERLSQVIFNLVDNCISHAGQNIKVRLRLILLKNGAVRVEVSDNGRGIPKEKQSLIWKINYSSTQEKRYHSGLGLSIVSSILEQHKAQYGVESRPGRGSTFWFVLGP